MLAFGMHHKNAMLDLVVSLTGHIGLTDLLLCNSCQEKKSFVKQNKKTIFNASYVSNSNTIDVASQMLSKLLLILVCVYTVS